MARTSTCQKCKAKDAAPKVKEDKKNFHDTDACIGEYRRKKEANRKEQEQKDELYYKLVKVHNLNNTQEIPTLFYMKIAEVRNDSGLLGRVNKKYKEGIPYGLLSYTYDYCKKRIDESLLNKTFDTKLDEMFYCLGIVRNNVADAYNHKLQEIKNQKTIQITTEMDQSLNSEVKIKHNKKDDLDISSLL